MDAHTLNHINNNYNNSNNKQTEANSDSYNLVSLKIDGKRAREWIEGEEKKKSIVCKIEIVYVVAEKKGKIFQMHGYCYL